MDRRNFVKSLAPLAAALGFKPKALASADREVAVAARELKYEVWEYEDRIEYRLNGKLHREGGPAIESFNGGQRWYLHGKLHRKDGPAIEFSEDHKVWYLHGQVHREDGPAVEKPDGTKMWYIDGELHREDGPAVEYSDGTKLWYIYGVEKPKNIRRA